VIDLALPQRATVPVYYGKRATRYQYAFVRMRYCALKLVIVAINVAPQVVLWPS
jgi:hypothetical protein